MSVLTRDVLLRRLRAIGEPLRLRILEVLAGPAGERAGPLRHGEPGMCLSDLQLRLGRAHPLVSHHVQVLHRAGLIRRLRRGRWALLQVEASCLTELGLELLRLARVGALRGGPARQRCQTPGVGRRRRCQTPGVGRRDRRKRPNALTISGCDASSPSARARSVLPGSVRCQVEAPDG